MRNVDQQELDRLLDEIRDEVGATGYLCQSPAANRPWANHFATLHRRLDDRPDPAWTGRRHS